MKRSRFGEEQIITTLKQQESGVATAEMCRQHGISTPINQGIPIRHCSRAENASF
jgi:hypothetical protein